MDLSLCCCVNTSGITPNPIYYFSSMIDPVRQGKSFAGGGLDPNYSGFVLIGAGLPRTGVTSLRVALGRLLEGPCYHAADAMVGGLEAIRFWSRALDGDVDREEWVQVLQGKGYRASVDFPCVMFYKELMDAYPDAKVLLSTRDPDRWFRSLSDTIRAEYALNDRWFIRMAMRIFVGPEMLELMDKCKSHPMVGPMVYGTEEEAKALYHKWMAEVKKTVPKDRLLEYRVQEGWEPLCKFLGVPVPDEPFPRANDTAEMQARIAVGRRIGYVVDYVVPAVVGAAIAYYVFV